eukprot:SAG31_NODE_904_length_11120_cov_76.575084_4_plen_241_part_00
MRPGRLCGPRRTARDGLGDDSQGSASRRGRCEESAVRTVTLSILWGFFPAEYAVKLRTEKPGTKRERVAVQAARRAEGQGWRGGGTSHRFLRQTQGRRWDGGAGGDQTGVPVQGVDPPRLRRRRARPRLRRGRSGKDCYFLDSYGTFRAKSPMYAPRKRGRIEKVRHHPAGRHLRPVRAALVQRIAGRLGGGARERRRTWARQTPGTAPQGAPQLVPNSPNESQPITLNYSQLAVPFSFK